MKSKLNWKPISLLLAVILLFNPLGISQLNAADLPQTTQVFTSPALPNVVVVVANNMPLYSLDGGLSWHSLATTPWPTSGDIQVAIAPRAGVENPVRIVVAHGRTIYRTGDFGQTWSQILLEHSVDCGDDYFGSFMVAPVDPNRLFVTQICFWSDWMGYLGYDYSVLTSPDAGITWTYIRAWSSTPTPSPVLANRLYVKDERDGTWFQTDDSGSTWITKTFPVKTLALDAQNADYLYGLTGGGGQRSRDGGASWAPWPNQPCAAYSQLLPHPTLTNILLVVCGENLYRSSNGGDSWEQWPAYGSMLASDYGHAGRLFLVRPDGLWGNEAYGLAWTHLTVDYLTPRSATWQWYKAQLPGPGADRYAFAQIDVVTPNDIWAAGLAGQLFHWDGQFWTTVGQESLSTMALDMLSTTDGWCVRGYMDISPPDEDYLMHWDGLAWTTKYTLTTSLKAIKMVSADDGWAVGSEVLHWNGTDWTPFATPLTQTLFSLSMLSSTDGWAVGAGGTLARWNGSEWMPVTSPVTQTLRSVKMLSSEMGWAVGDEGVIVRWDGASWTAVASPTSYRLNSVDLLVSEAASAVGEAGTILDWDGNAWSLSRSPTQSDLWSVAMISAEKGWAGGNTMLPLVKMKLSTLFLPSVLR